MSSTTVATAVIDLAHDLRAIANAPEYDLQAPALLAALLPADELIWARVDFISGTATVRGASSGDEARASGLARYGQTHQGVRSFERSPDDKSPRRMSDVATQAEWHGTALYNELYRPFGHAYQLGLLTHMGMPGVGSGWTFTRTSSDFTDREMEIAGRILPVLIALEGSRAALSERASVTVKPRERILLAHLAGGLTARAIGWRMGISERTVRKHLGALYVTLECNDRLVAVQRARDLGLLPR